MNNEKTCVEGRLAQFTKIASKSVKNCEKLNSGSSMPLGDFAQAFVTEFAGIYSGRFGLKSGFVLASEVKEEPKVLLPYVIVATGEDVEKIINEDVEKIIKKFSPANCIDSHPKLYKLLDVFGFREITPYGIELLKKYPSMSDILRKEPNAIHFQTMAWTCDGYHTSVDCFDLARESKERAETLKNIKKAIKNVAVENITNKAIEHTFNC